MAGVQVYEMRVGGRDHRVETSVGDGWSNRATWWVDGEEIASERSATSDDLYLVADEEHALADEVGAVRARFTTLSKPVRATWWEGSRSDAETAARVGVGGLDLVPEPGSPAALREERMRARPRLYAARHVAAGVGKVVVPLLLAALAAWLVVRIPWPDWDLPSIPWPSIDLPSIPWPSIDLPSIPWPDWQLPGWVRWVLDHAKYVVPILIGIALARSEVRRRREQDSKRRELAGGSGVGHVAATEADDAEPGEEEPTDSRDERTGDVERLGRDVADEPEGRPLDEP